ncbi:LOW QUALITY PROTEIN: CAP-Gly domain-containing linker protein 3-like [Rhinoraja longicauda]
MTKENVLDVAPEEGPLEQQELLPPGLLSPLPERRKKPVVHHSAPAPLPKDYAFTFFDPNDPACQEILFDPQTTVSELFAIIRQWVPQVQHKIDTIGNEVNLLKRGCHVHDRDGLTDMTLRIAFMPVSAPGLGDPAAAARLCNHLIALGADVGLRSRWTSMNALHYAAYFDVPEITRILLKAHKPKVLNSTCSDFNHGTALHIAASNLCLGAVKCLLEHGANPALRVSHTDTGHGTRVFGRYFSSVSKISKILDQTPSSVTSTPKKPRMDFARMTGKAKKGKKALRRKSLSVGSLDPEGQKIEIGDQVLVASQKPGVIRYYGKTDFAPGYWYGIELDKATGKHDGSVFGVRYYTCLPKYGVFAPPSRVQRIGGPKTTGDGSISKKIHQVTMTQPKRNLAAVRNPKDISSESSISRLLFCCWFPWMLRAEMQS